LTFTYPCLRRLQWFLFSHVRSSKKEGQTPPREVTSKALNWGLSCPGALWSLKRKVEEGTRITLRPLKPHPLLGGNWGNPPRDGDGGPMSLLSCWFNATVRMLFFFRARKASCIRPWCERPVETTQSDLEPWVRRVCIRGGCCSFRFHSTYAEGTWNGRKRCVPLPSPHCGV